MGDKDNLTALHYACVNGNKELIQYLVEELKCDVGEFVGACLHMTACDNQGFIYRETKIASHHKVVGRPMGRDGNLLPCQLLIHLIMQYQLLN